MAAEDNQSESTPPATKSAPIPGEQAASPTESPSEKPPIKPSDDEKDQFLRSVKTVKHAAAKAAAKPFQFRDPNVWAVLTAVSNKARERKQGLNMVLNGNVHFIGRLVEDNQFQIDSKVVSGEHCKIYRQPVASGDDALKSEPVVFLKDNSTNGTYVNWKKLTRKDEAVEIRHGDIISLVGPPNTDIAFAFVYREVVKSAVSSNRVVIKRKAEEPASESERVKRVDSNAAEDFQSLLHTNMELRKEVEDNAAAIEKLQNEKRGLEHHKNEMRKEFEDLRNQFEDMVKQFEDQAVIIAKLQNENLEFVEHHPTEVSKKFEDLRKQFEDLSMQFDDPVVTIDKLQNENQTEINLKELAEEVSKLSAERNTIDDLDGRLCALQMK